MNVIKKGDPVAIGFDGLELVVESLTYMCDDLHKRKRNAQVKDDPYVDVKLIGRKISQIHKIRAKILGSL